MRATNSLTIATRESPLAIAQARFVENALIKHFPDLHIHLLKLTTSGDKFLDDHLFKVGGKGLFVKELEQALLDGRADVAVHSMKDVPVNLPDTLDLPVICKRHSPFDVFVSNQYENIFDLPVAAKIGTSSLRRQCQLLALRPDLNILPLRGNVQTRLEKLDRGDFDAIVLAEAGLERLQLSDRVASVFTEEMYLPAVGQGALGIECRREDDFVLQKIEVLHDAETAYCVLAERAMNQALNGGCHVPIAAYAKIQNSQLHLQGLVGSLDGKLLLKAQEMGEVYEYLQIGRRVAEQLKMQGAEKILRAVFEA